MGDYDELTVEELKDELASRELPVSGNKAELIDRLEEDDGEEEVTEEETTVSTEGVDEVISQALALEAPLRDAADNVVSGPNTDALKAAIRSAAHGIAHIRKVLDMNVRLS